VSVRRPHINAPFALMWRYELAPDRYDSGVHHRYRLQETAEQEMRDLTFAIARLVGARRSPLTWYVRDERDGSIIHFGRPRKGTSDHDQQDTQPSRLF
jgi:hypothetical protein